MSERKSIRLPGGQIMYLCIDEEDAAIRTAIEADPDQREGNPQPPGTVCKQGLLPYRMRKADLRAARKHGTQSDTEDE